MPTYAHYSKQQQNNNITSIRKSISSLDYLRVFMRQDNIWSLLQRNKALYLHGLQELPAARVSELQCMLILCFAESALTLALETAHSSLVLQIDKQFPLKMLSHVFLLMVHTDSRLQSRKPVWYYEESVSSAKSEKKRSPWPRQVE